MKAAIRAPFSLRNRRALRAALIALFLLLAVLFRLGGRSLENQDNLKFAEIAREINEYGDWVLLREGGALYVDKPPLHFWITAALYRVFSTNAFGARLTSACMALLLFGLCYAAGRRFLGSSEAGITAGLALLGNYLVFSHARSARIDLTFCVCFSAALLCFFSAGAARHESRRFLWAACFWSATALALLTKGPPPVLCMAPVLLTSTFVCFERPVRAKLWAAVGLTLPWLFLLLFPWLLALLREAQFPSYLAALKAAQFITRHAGFWYYFYQLPLKLLPGTPFLGAALVALWRRRREERSAAGITFCLLWLFGVLLCLQSVSTRSHRYLLMVSLPAAVLMARGGGLPGGALLWYDRFVLAGTLGLFFWPFAVAWHSGGSLLSFLFPVAVLGLCLPVARRLFTGRPAKLFATFLVGFLAYDLGREARNEKTSPFLMICRTARVHPRELGLAGISAPVRGALGFYLGTLPPAPRPLGDLLKDPSVKAIVASPEALRGFPKEKLSSTAVLRFRKGYTLLLKGKRSNDKGG